MCVFILACGCICELTPMFVCMGEHMCIVSVFVGAYLPVCSVHVCIYVFCGFIKPK